MFLMNNNEIEEQEGKEEPCVQGLWHLRRLDPSRVIVAIFTAYP